VLWGTELLVQIQTMSSPILTALFRGITFLGNAEFYVFALPVIWWCIDRAVALRVGYLVLLSATLNTGLKDLFGFPRPDPEQVRWLVEAEGYGFPSGHAQSAAAVVTYLARRAGTGKAWVGAILFAFLVGFSRMYLGVHFPADVLGGWTIGLLFTLLYSCLTDRHASRVAGLSLWAKLALAVVAPLLLLAIHTTPDTVRNLSAAIGVGLGAVLEREWLRFQVEGSWPRKAGRLLLGAIGLAAIYLGLKAVLPTTPVFRGLRYALLGLWATFLAPWLFVATRLADRE
jgi:membrane-associated phospholipid phosphatase